MKLQDVKNRHIEDYLQSLGYTPVKRQGVNLWYKSPLRDERTPSFKVNAALNKWYDFGIGKGGNIIALAAELYGSSHLPYLLECIGRQEPKVHFTKPDFAPALSECSFQHLTVHNLSHPALLHYLQERKIDIGIAQMECRELHYIHRDKPYFAVGFPNVAGGYEIRNPFFKGCISPKDISCIRLKDDTTECCLFEGFMDYLSYRTLQLGDETLPDCVVLNSVSNVKKAQGILSGYGTVCCFLDRDDAGRKTLELLQQAHPGR